MKTTHGALLSFTIVLLYESVAAVLDTAFKLDCYGSVPQLKTNAHSKMMSYLRIIKGTHP